MRTSPGRMGGKGSAVQLGGERAEPTPKQQIAQRNDCAPAIDAISVFAPWSGEAERGLRLRLHKARDIASARASRSTFRRARLLYGVAAELASDWVFCRAESEALEDVLNALAQIFMAAGKIEKREATDAW